LSLAGRGARRLVNPRTLVGLAVFAYLVFVRTRRITETFVLLGDQILYWNLALGPWRELPLGGGPSSVGGTTLGPVFVWTVWAIRVVVGPWTDNLPHAGGIGIALIQSAADAILLVAIWRRTASLPLALAVTLLVATSPLDLALSATIWNPPLAEAFVKAAIALVLAGGPAPSFAWSLGASATAVLAVQAHSAAIFFAAPVAASFVLADAAARRWSVALQRARATIEVIVLVELPFLVNLVVNRPERVAPSMVVEGLATAAADPGSLRLRQAFDGVSGSLGHILLSPATPAWFGGALLAALCVTAVRLRRDVPLLCATVAPLAAAVIGFAAWPRGYEVYWFMPLAPCAAVTLALATTAWQPAARLVAVAALAVIVYAQPARLAASFASHRLPEYGALVRASREIRARTPAVRAIETEFALPPSADRTYLYRILGGRIAPDAPFSALVRSSGAVVYTPAPR
jgi:hypothetical protein